jgi:hypothetical protein
MAYVLIDVLRRVGMRMTRLPNATCGSIRLKLFTIGSLLTHQLSARQDHHRRTPTEFVGSRARTPAPA